MAYYLIFVKELKVIRLIITKDIIYHKQYLKLYHVLSFELGA